MQHLCQLRNTAGTLKNVRHKARPKASTVGGITQGSAGQVQNDPAAAGKCCCWQLSRFIPSAGRKNTATTAAAEATSQLQHSRQRDNMATQV